MRHPEVVTSVFAVCLIQWSGVHQALPDNVHLLTLEQYPSFGPVPSLTQPFLLRLEHFYEKGEDAVLSQPVTVNLQVGTDSLGWWWMFCVGRSR